MDKVCISIVITVYNIENYIKRCVESVINQTFKNIEILLIDDGSQDSSAEICDLYARDYTFIRVLHIENSGPAAARNHGIRNAKGEYICFFDGDDFVDQTYLQYLYDQVKNNNLDILIANYIIYPSMTKEEHLYTINQLLSGKELMNSNKKIHTHNDLCACWRMIYRVDFLKASNINFNEKICYGEDTEFNIRALVLADRTMAIDGAGYFYETSRDTSLMKSSSKPMYDSSLVEQYKTRKNRYGLNKAYDDDLYRYYIECVFWNMIRNAKSRKALNKDYIKNILNYEMLCDAKKYFRFAYKTKSIKDYIIYLLMCFNCSTFLMLLCKKG